MLKDKKFTIAFFSWMVFVTWASLATFPEDTSPGFEVPHLDKVVHFCFYLGAAILGALFIRETSQGKAPLIRSLIFVVLGAILFGIIIEVIQYTFTQNRQGDFWDALANSCGAIVGGVAMKWLFWEGKRLKWK